MCLSKQTANDIVDAVRKDARARKRIDSGVAYLVPDRARAAGWIRNIGLWGVSLVDGANWPHKYTCVGVAGAAVDAINAAALADVEQSDKIDRFDPAHTATRVILIDGSSWVFDWHNTLNVGNPVVYTEADWSAKRGGMQFAHFSGQGCGRPGCASAAGTSEPSPVSTSP